MRVISFCALLLILVSCGRQRDNSAPTIQRFSINGQETEATASSGSTISVLMQFNDNVELNQYRLSIGENFSKANGFEFFSTVVVNSIGGQNHTTTVNIAIPDSTVAGTYLAELDAIDQNGNESTTATLVLHITNSGEQPSVNITSPDVSNPVEISKGDTLHLTGTITDNTDLELVCLTLDGDSLLYDQEFDLNDTIQSIWNFDQLVLEAKWVIIPPTANNGNYTLRTRAEDNDEHLTVHQATVTVVD